MPFTTTLRVARVPLAAFAAMGAVWGGFAAELPELKAMLGVNEVRLGLLILFTPVAAVTAMLFAPLIGAALGRLALPVATLAMATAFALPGQAASVWIFPLAMLCCGAATGLTDVLMNARVSQLENDRGLHLMNLTHAAYSFGYAGGAIGIGVGVGVMRSAGWSPARVMGTIALLALLLALATIEAGGTIRGLRRPKGAGAERLGLIPVIGGGIVLIAFLTENAAENWSAWHIEQTLGGSPAAGAAGPATIAMTMGCAAGRAGTGRAGTGRADRGLPAAGRGGGAVGVWSTVCCGRHQPGNGLCRVHRDGNRVISDFADGLFPRRTPCRTFGAGKGSCASDVAGIFRIFFWPAAFGGHRGRLRLAVCLRVCRWAADVRSGPRPLAGPPEGLTARRFFGRKIFFFPGTHRKNSSYEEFLARYQAQFPSKSAGTSTWSRDRSVAFCTPHKAIDVSSSARMTASARATPACPIAPRP